MQYCAHCGNAVEAVSYAPCPRCGKPSNGAPPPAAAAKGTSPALIIVLVIAGLLVVIAIIGILAAIAIPNLLTATQRAKQKRTMADIRTLAVAVEAYSTDHNEYPKGSAPADLVGALVPTYIRALPEVDGWGTRFQYVCLKDAKAPESEKCVGYLIGSGGKDMRFEHDSLLETLAGPERPTTNFDCDIVYSGGKFVEYPEGVQH